MMVFYLYHRTEKLELGQLDRTTGHLNDIDAYLINVAANYGKSMPYMEQQESAFITISPIIIKQPRLDDT